MNFIHFLLVAIFLIPNISMARLPKSDENPGTEQTAPRLANAVAACMERMMANDPTLDAADVGGLCNFLAGTHLQEQRVADSYAKCMNRHRTSLNGRAVAALNCAHLQAEGDTTTTEPHSEALINTIPEDETSSM